MNSENGDMMENVENDENSVDVDDEYFLLSYKTNSEELFIRFNSETLEDDSSVESLGSELRKPRNIKCIQFGIYEIDTAYYSPYPEDYGAQFDKMFICEYCLKYMRLEKSYRYHLGECAKRSPPGVEIYKQGSLAIYEIDSRDERLYCQNLCLLAKLFIDHKTVFYDVEQFLFYVLCEVDKHGAHLRGYFSKEKDSPDGYNLACIVILPPFQGKGYGHLLIGFSYELSKIEGIPGSPEKPLSELGSISYSSYWCWVLLKILKDFRGTMTISSLSKMTGFTETDILNTLQSLGLLKYWSNHDTACISYQMVDTLIESGHFRRPRLTVDPTAIKWVPSSWSSRKSSSEASDM